MIETSDLDILTKTIDDILYRLRGLEKTARHCELTLRLLAQSGKGPGNVSPDQAAPANPTTPRPNEVSPPSPLQSLIRNPRSKSKPEGQ